MEEVSEQDVMNDNNDRISDLHDSIIMHILSFLTAKEAVHTCLLSKRWRDLWAYLPCLNLDFEEFDSEQLFERFVFSLLLLRKIPYIDTFRLKLVYADACGDPEDVKASNTWIHHVLRSKPRVISFNCGVYDPLDLPTSFFCCHSLEDVTLMLFYDPDIRPGIINLPRLKRLKFGYISIRDQLMQNVISGCPVLEQLELVNCPLYVSNISSSMLKCLSILDLSIVDCKNGREITIDTPNLESLRLVGEFVNGFKLRNMQSLVSAFLSVSKCGSFGCEILSGLSNVRQLELFGSALKYILIVELQECPTFVNLKQLTLDEFFNDAELESIFLGHSPNLREILFSKSEVKNVCDSDSDNGDDSEEYDDSDDNDDGDDDDDTGDDEDDDDGDVDDDTDDDEDDDGDDAM